MNDDSKLTYAEKLELIKWIPIRQQERWARMKNFHNMDHIKMSVRYFFMKNEIKLMRDQRERLIKLKKEVLQ